MLDRIAETGLSCPLNRRMQRHRGHNMSDIFPEQKNQALIEAVARVLADRCRDNDPRWSRGHHEMLHEGEAIEIIRAIEAVGYRIVPAP